MLALREIERRRRVADRLAACVADPRAAERVVHSLADILGFRMLMIAAGYEDGTRAARFSHGSSATAGRPRRAAVSATSLSPIVVACRPA